MIFTNCTVDTRRGNILTSPQVTQSANQELTFSMVSVPDSDYSRVDVYKTSMFGHIDTLLGSFSSEWNTLTAAGEVVTHAICSPVGTHQLVFVASDVENAIRSTAAITNVLLTDNACTYTSLAGVSRQHLQYIIHLGASDLFSVFSEPAFA